MRPILIVAFVGLSVAGAHAQSLDRITLLEGSVYAGSGGIESAGGRAAIALEGGARLHLDQQTRVRVDSPSRVTLLDGRIVLYTGSAGIDVVAPGAVLYTAPGGVYDLTADARADRVLVRVSAGEIDLDGRYGRASIAPAQMVYLMADTRPLPTPYAATASDAFWQWSCARGAARPAYGSPVAMAPDYAREQSGYPVFVPGYPSYDRGRHWPRSAASLPSAPDYAPTYMPNYAPNYGVGSLPPNPVPPAEWPRVHSQLREPEAPRPRAERPRAVVPPRQPAPPIETKGAVAGVAATKLP